jgi:ABC-type phosphate/phosphonate transport system ATPase subunit
LNEIVFPLASVKQKYKKIRREISLPINVGERIVVVGPMASGKSTLAVKFGDILKISVYHLDQLCFLPGTFWVKKPKKELKSYTTK